MKPTRRCQSMNEDMVVIYYDALFYGELEVRVLMPVVGSDILVSLRAEIQAPLRQCCEAPNGW